LVSEEEEEEDVFSPVTPVKEEKQEEREDKKEEAKVSVSAELNVTKRRSSVKFEAEEIPPLHLFGR